jgi:hypothetical protein
MNNMKTGSIVVTMALTFTLAFGIMWLNRNPGQTPERISGAATAIGASEPRLQIRGPMAPPEQSGAQYSQVPATTANGPRPSAAPPPEAEAAKPFIDTVAESNVETDGGGNFIGIRVIPSEDRQTFFHSGLNTGDIIVAIDGTQLDAQRGQEMWNQVGTGAVLTVKRWAGKLETVTLNLAP